MQQRCKKYILQTYVIIFLMNFEYWYIKIILDIGSLIMYIEDALQIFVSHFSFGNFDCLH